MRTLSGGRTALALGLALAAASCSGGPGPGSPSSLPVEDDFSDCATRWSTDTDEFVSFSCTGGAYRLLIKNPVKPQSSTITFSKGVTSVEIEADATYQAGPRTAAYGVGCWASAGQGYIFAVSPGAAWVILKWKDGSMPTQLAGSDAENAIPGFSDSNRIRGECIGGGQKPTALALYVNGKKIGTAEDPGGLASFPTFGFTVFSTEAGADVRFDNFVAREATEAEVASSGTATEPSQESPAGTTAESSAEGLCKRDGIRYAGTTAQGAEVCFTLTPDRSAWVEIGFTFVRASGCRDMAAGTNYSEGPVSLDASGRIKSSGFTAMIRPDDFTKASGVFADSDICPGKKFKWRARLQP